MAGAHCANASFFLPFPNTTPIPRKPVVLVSSISISSPSKLTKRKNYLRPKLFKTLTKPYPNPILPQSPPTILIESPHEQQQPESLSSDQFSGEELKESESREFQLSETSNSAGVSEGSVRNFSTRSVLQFGLYLVGIFVFQTICAVWVIGSVRSDHKDGNLDSEDRYGVLELGLNGNNKAKSKFLLNGCGKLGVEQGGIVSVDEFELEEKIVEIRAMARNAREQEILELKAANNFDDDDGVVKSGIEKEVDSRLVKLQKRLQSIREKSPMLPVSYLSKDGVDMDGLDAKEEHGALIFKKKYKFRSPLSDPSNKSKGFMGLEDRSITKMKNSSSAKENEMLSNGSIGNNGVDLLNKDQQLDVLDVDGDLLESVSMSSEEDGGRKPPKEQTKSVRTPVKNWVKKRGRTKLENEMEVAKTEPKTGILQESSNGRPLVEALQSGESGKLEALSAQSFTKEKHDTTTRSNNRDMLSTNGSLKSRKVVSQRSANKVGDKKSDTQTDLWWLSLPYVLAILMRRGHDGEGPQGLFTLKSFSNKMGDSSHTIAFEDRVDATNFCYLLQSFFEELGDFSADIVVLSINELDEAVKSHTMKVIVVKKGQLQLYAGQPLADVEMALRSLVGQI